ncbi:MAG: hypothetical protein RIQ93_341 [Verrucomicrobiota bacterium]|jgi:hypothetical protein
MDLATPHQPGRWSQPPSVRRNGIALSGKSSVSRERKLHFRRAVAERYDGKVLMTESPQSAKENASDHQPLRAARATPPITRRIS